MSAALAVILVVVGIGASFLLGLLLGAKGWR